jgi:F-type H+-transporting ATPase subunit gamma
MANTQDLRRRIRSIRNTMQLTRAMKMVSGAKLRRAQNRVMSARPYAERTRHILASLACRADPELNPLLQSRDGRQAEFLVVTSDRGLCGAFNASLLRTAENYAVDNLPGHDVTWSCVGKKGRDHFRHRGHPVDRAWVDVFRDFGFDLAVEIARAMTDRYLKGEADSIYLAYNQFKSAIQSVPTVLRLLPVEAPEATAEEQGAEDYIYEPSAEGLLSDLLPHYLEITLFRALLESSAAEHAARMTAMDNATKNAGELIESLTLTMNRVRQASITTEIIEVVSGAQALG